MGFKPSWNPDEVIVVGDAKNEDEPSFVYVGEPRFDDDELPDLNKEEADDEEENDPLPDVIDSTPDDANIMASVSAVASTKAERLEMETLHFQSIMGEMSNPYSRPKTLGEGANVQLSSGGLKAMFYGHPVNAESVQPPFFDSSSVRLTAGVDEYKREDWGQIQRKSKRITPLRKRLRETIQLDARDVDMLYFISVHNPVTPLALAILTGQRVKDVVQRLFLLEEAGLVDIDMSMDAPIYAPTQFTISRLGVDVSNSRKSAQSLMWFKHNYMLVMLAAELTTGRMVIGGDSAPYSRPPVKKFNGKTILPHGSLWGTSTASAWEIDSQNGRRIGENVLTEAQLRSSFASAKKEMNDASASEVILHYRRKIREWDGNGIAPELLLGNEASMFVTDTLTNREHAPDMVLKRPRRRGEQPNSVCVEFENTLKKKDPDKGIHEPVDYYVNLLTTILSQGVYGHVAYFTSSPSVGKVIYEAMQIVDELEGLDGVKGSRLHLIQTKPGMGDAITGLFVR